MVCPLPKLLTSVFAFTQQIFSRYYLILCSFNVLYDLLLRIHFSMHVIWDDNFTDFFFHDPYIEQRMYCSIRN